VQADDPGSRADEECQAAGGARREGVERAMRGRGGPRSSTDRATISVDRGAMLIGARTSSAGEPAGIRTRGAAVRSAGWASRIVSTQPQSAGHVVVPETGRADLPQLPSLASMGDTQQQNQGVFPQVRPSHCQTASAWGVSAERRSAASAKIQIVRAELTLLLSPGTGQIADQTYRCRASAVRRRELLLQTGLTGRLGAPPGIAPAAPPDGTGCSARRRELPPPARTAAWRA
jgi:hypothetical protein